MTVLTTNFAENDRSVISKNKKSLLSSKSHFCPVNVTSVQLFLLGFKTFRVINEKCQFCLQKSQFCPLIICNAKYLIEIREQLQLIIKRRVMHFIHRLQLICVYLKENNLSDLFLSIATAKAISEPHALFLPHK